jgi:hypothetical protein
MTTRPTVDELLTHPDAYLQRRDLFELGLGRRAVDAIVSAIGRQVPGYSRPVVPVGDWLAYREEFTYRGDRPRPTGISRSSGA